MVENRRNYWNGLDIGTVNLVSTERNGNGQAVLRLKRSPFIEIPADDRTRILVTQMKAPHALHGDRIYVLGDAAYELAGVVKAPPPLRGMPEPVSPAKADPLPAMKALLESIAEAPANGNGAGLFDTLHQALSRNPEHVIDGHAVEFSRPAEEDFAGIGIFCGGGLFDICVAYKALPVIFFSTSRGGEWVDLQAATDLGVKSFWASKPRAASAPGKGEENEIAGYYRILINNTLNNIKSQLRPAAGMPEFPDPISLVFSGATSMVGNYIELVRTVEKSPEASAPTTRIQLSSEAPAPAAKVQLSSAVEKLAAARNLPQVAAKVAKAAALPRQPEPTPEPAAELTAADYELDGEDPAAHLNGDGERRLVDFRRYQPLPGRGLDVGTSNVVGAVRAFNGDALCNIQRNAFLDVRSDVFTEKLLMKLGVDRYGLGNKRFVIGNPAFEFANIFEKATRRPMKNGLMSPSEADAIFVEGLVIRSVVGRAPADGEICAYSVQAEPIDAERNAVYHSGAIETILKQLGYAPRPVLEGQAVVYAELADEEYTGIGISCGGGQFNICISYKSLPALAFSISRGGDWIDANVAQSLGLPSSQVCAIKENGVDLNDPKGRIEEAICIYYRNLIHYSIETIREKFESAQNMPAFRTPISVVCSGGTSMIKGFIDVFREEFRTINFPIEVKEIRRAADPLRTVARGCLEAAVLETRVKSEAPVSPKLDRADVSSISSIPKRPAVAAKTDQVPPGPGKSSAWWVVVDPNRPSPLEGPACA